MVMYSKFAVILSFVFLGVSTAEGATPSTPGIITEISQTNDLGGPNYSAVHGVWITTSSPIHNEPNCPNNPSAYFLPDDVFVIPGTNVKNTKWKQNFAMILAAYMSKSPVKFWVYGCYGSAPIIMNVTID